MFEIPDELVEKWMASHLEKMLPPSRRDAFREIAVLAIERAKLLRTGEIAEWKGDQLWVAADPHGEEVLDLVFTCGKPYPYSRVGDEWVRSYGIGDYEYKCFRMLQVKDGALCLFDERRLTGGFLGVSELRVRGLLQEPEGRSSGT